METGKGLFLHQIDTICDRTGAPRHKAFLRWICSRVMGVTDEGLIDEAVSIDGKGDYGIDIFHSDPDGDVTEGYTCWFQAKFADDLDHVVTREELYDFAGTLGRLRRCPDHANMTFKQKAAEFASTEDGHPRIRKRMIFAATGRLNEQASEMIKTDEWWRGKIGNGSDSNVRLEVLDLDKILSYMTVPPTPALKVRFKDGVLESTDSITGKKSVIGYMPADMLVRIAREHKDTLFLENPRKALGASAPTHKAILGTLEDDSKRPKFWKLNNGITAICTGLEQSADDPDTWSVTDFKIVNGRQTMFTLEKAASRIDDVCLLVSIHDTVNDGEKNLISQTTNTQNPIKPVDLVSNYPEMAELVLQCRKDYPEFYFERQRRGFESLNLVDQNRVTTRRVLEKSRTAKAYYAYAIDPNTADMHDKILFSALADPNHYEIVFKDRNIRDLIIPHIFMQMLTALHKKWCAKMSDSPSPEMLRRKGILSKGVVKYYILRFIHESMMGLDGPARESVQDAIVERFRRLGEKDPMPEEFLEIAEAAYDDFMFSFDSDRSETWPKRLLDRMKDNSYEEKKDDEPAPYDIMSVLKARGEKILPHLLRMRLHVVRRGDRVGERLLALVPDQN